MKNYWKYELDKYELDKIWTRQTNTNWKKIHIKLWKKIFTDFKIYFSEL